MHTNRQSTLLTLIGSLLIVVTVNAQTIQNTIRPKINRIADKLKKENEVHLGYAVGFAGKPETKNKYYKLYLKLKTKATNEELALLTKDNCKPLVIYSYIILHSRAYKNLKDIFIEHLNDTTFYWTASGCTGVIDRVNWFMLRRLNPKSLINNTGYLTKEEYDLYCSKFNKQDEFFRCD